MPQEKTEATSKYSYYSACVNTILIARHMGSLIKILKLFESARQKSSRELVDAPVQAQREEAPRKISKYGEGSRISRVDKSNGVGNSLERF